MRMDWTQATIWTSSAGLDAVTGLLLDQGIEGFVIEDAQDFAQFLEGTELYWDYVDEELVKEKQQAETNIKIYVDNGPKGAEQISLLRGALSGLRQRDTENAFGRLEITLDTVRQEDWENNWKQYFKPFKVGETFYIKPSWETLDDVEGRTVLEIDPSSSFGTGTHETTQLCICFLEKYLKKGDRVLDMGCGSGILSVAASLLGAKDITAVDIDPIAVKIALENAQKNGMDLKTFVGDAAKDEALCQKIGGGYQVIAANIVADVIISMRSIFLDKLSPEGVLIVSGILAPRADEVIQALTGAGLQLVEKRRNGDWVACSLRR